MYSRERTVSHRYQKGRFKGETASTRVHPSKCDFLQTLSKSQPTATATRLIGSFSAVNLQVPSSHFMN